MLVNLQTSDAKSQDSRSWLIKLKFGYRKLIVYKMVSRVEIFDLPKFAYYRPNCMPVEYINSYIWFGHLKTPGDVTNGTTIPPHRVHCCATDRNEWPPDRSEFLLFDPKWFVIGWAGCWMNCARWPWIIRSVCFVADWTNKNENQITHENEHIFLVK